MFWGTPAVSWCSQTGWQVQETPAAEGGGGGDGARVVCAGVGRVARRGRRVGSDGSCGSAAALESVRQCPGEAEAGERPWCAPPTPRRPRRTSSRTCSDVCIYWRATARRFTRRRNGPSSRTRRRWTSSRRKTSTSRRRWRCCSASAGRRRIRARTIRWRSSPARLTSSRSATMSSSTLQSCGSRTS